MFIVATPVAGDGVDPCFNHASGYLNRIEGQLERLDTLTFSFNSFFTDHPCTGLPFSEPTLTVFAFARTTNSQNGQSQLFIRIDYPDIGFTTATDQNSVFVDEISDVGTLTRTDIAICHDFGTGTVVKRMLNDMPVDFGQSENNPWIIELGGDSFLAVLNSGDCNSRPDI